MKHTYLELESFERATLCRASNEGKSEADRASLQRMKDYPVEAGFEEKRQSRETPSGNDFRTGMGRQQWWTAQKERQKVKNPGVAYALPSGNAIPCWVS
ncbi:hypothetical protein Tco_1155789 [Tanacetum coccineum]